MSDAAAWGIEEGYHGVDGVWQVAPPATVTAILGAMGAEGPEPDAGAGVWLHRAGEPLFLAGRWELQTEDGASEVVSGTVEGIPAGYHDLYRDDGRGLRLIVSPGRCHLPTGLRTWGWAVQLYALRSAASWGHGDLADLARLGEWASAQGAGMALVNPLHAPLPVGDPEPSPYYATSRCFRSPLYLRVEDVPGAAALPGGLEAAAAAGRALNDERRIDRRAVWRIKAEALERIWRAVRAAPPDPFAAYRADQGDPLQRYATFCALAEVHGPRWRDWPADVRHPGNPDVGRFAAHRAERVDFHCWLQWLIDTQLARAGSTIALVADLAVGADPEGADAWLWQDCLAPGVTVGAPADEFNQRGQDWALPPFDPWKLRAARYEPFIQALRAGFRHAGGLRVDHVMGLFRLFWVPAGASPSEGTYVRYPWRELLDLVALESQRAGAYVVGEDLGNVEDATRAALAEAAVLSYRLAWFEPGPPATFPPLALGALGTHDLPTVAGLWTGADLDAQRRFGMTTNAGATRSLIDRIAGWTGLVPGESPAGEVVRRTYGLLAEAPCALLAASLDDVLEVAERPNYPGTVVPEDWSSALPLALEAIVADPRPAEVARILSRR